MKLIYKILAGIFGMILSILLVMVGRKAISKNSRKIKVNKAVAKKNSKSVKVVEDKDKKLSEKDANINKATLLQEELAREIKKAKTHKLKNSKKRG